MSTPDNLGALEAAGFTIKTPMPSEYQVIVDGLTPEEVELLVALKRKFDDAQRSTAPEVPPYTTFFVPL